MSKADPAPRSESQLASPAVPLGRYLLFFAIVALGCAADLATKSWAFSRLGYGETCWLWEGVLGVQTSLNEGALFGFGRGFLPGFALLSLAAALGILWWLFVARAAHDCWLTVALGAITAGIGGNLYDRLGLAGLSWPASDPLHQAGDHVYAVRDWVLVMLGQYQWPNFNVADSLLVCGAAMLVWHALRKDDPPSAPAPPPENR